MLLIRSVLFHIAFYLVTAFWASLCVFALVLPRAVVMYFARQWGLSCTRLFTLIVGGTYEVRGKENLPSGERLILASKHMSVFETFSLVPLVDDPLFILKRELTWIPLFGWAVAKGSMIPIDRGARAKTLRSMLARAKQKMAENKRQLIIFPEGTRRLRDLKPHYKFGITHVYKALEVPCYPVALNTGLFWGRQSFILYPGKIIVEILPPIPPGLEPNEFFERISTTIEENSDRLIKEAREGNSKLPPARNI
ncbi:lysophospholipid acyltransferase family protein [Cohaesibacter celericrescens]|uniref:1-acyl-sn-glycerol-3-phosphate acyltransferase n=1 Tax=Cohaesibacter celericrescens TaxID=2067669 RepID=A0A2N5XU69_9HYPH|nr:1-acyl-sn-glycerol-3-phosphate acyltransferase [Cohaesibacter celericrescens]PLW78053.1 1-acyl-sn-glycerol-3-phosphate acyltransferase [Cohaesibacter celericrescens]